MPADEASPHGQSPYSIRAVQRVCDLFDLLQRSPGGVTLPEAAEATGLPKSSTFRYLATLVTRGYARRDPRTGAYGPGLPLLASDLDALRVAVQPLLDDVAHVVQETVHLTVLEGGRAFHLVVADSPRTVRVVVARGASLPLHELAAGRAILAQLRPDEVRTLLPAPGQDTARLAREVAAIAARGWAFAAAEADPEASAVAVPLRLSRPAALGVVAPSSRLDVTRGSEVAGRLTAAAERVLVAVGRTRALGA